MVAVTVEAILGDPAARAEVTVTDLGVGDSLVTVWRLADGGREPVQGFRRFVMNDAGVVTDWAAPLGRPVSYEVEVLSGPVGPSRATSAPVVVDSVVGYIQDSLVPQTAVEIAHPYGANGKPVLASRAFASLEYAADVSLFKVMGSNQPMALFGQRMAAAGIDFSMISDAAEESNRLRELFMTAGQLLVRVPASWNSPVAGACFVAVAKIAELPVDAAQGGSLVAWEMSGDVTQAPTIRVLTGSFTYGDIEMLMSSYQQKQDLMAGKSYLDDLKNPLGG